MVEIFKVLKLSLNQKIKKYNYERTPEPKQVMENLEADKQYTKSGEEGSLSIAYEFVLLKLNKLLDENHKTALDVSCGSGQLISKIAKEFPEINFTAFDLSEEMLEIANKNNINTKNLKFEKVDMYKVKEKFQNKKFDLITWNFSMHHTDNPEQVIKIINNLLEILSENGVLFIIDNEKLKTKELVKDFSEIYSKKFGNEFYEDTYNSFIASYSFEEVEEILKKTNWKNYEHIHPIFGNFFQMIYSFGIKFSDNY